MFNCKDCVNRNTYWALEPCISCNESVEDIYPDLTSKFEPLDEELVQRGE